MSPRKTRRVVKMEAGDEKSVESDLNQLLNTSNEGHRTLRTRRQLKLMNSTDIDINISSQLNESKQPSRKSRNRKTIAENNDISVDINEPSNKIKNKKDKEVTMLEDSIIFDLSLLPDVLSTTKSNTIRGRTKGKKKKEDTNKNTVNEENENNKYVADKNAENMIISEIDKVSNEDIEVAAASKKNKITGNTPSNGRFIQLRKRHAISPNPTITPESSPITVSLTPHRSTKTPRKSPTNIGSPKTHSEAPQRISKTPRKLPVAADSPASSEQSSSINGTPQKITGDQENLTEKKNSPKNMTSVARKSSRISRSNSSRVILTKAKKSPTKNSPAKSPSISSPNEKSPMISQFNQSIKSPKLVLTRISLPETNDAAGIFLESSDVSDKEVEKIDKIQIIKNITPLVRASKIDIVSSTPRERIRRSLNLSPSVGMLPVSNRSPLKVESFYGTSPKISSTRIQHENSNINNEDVTDPLISDDESFDVNKSKLVESNEDTNVDCVEITDDESKSDDDDTYELAEPKTPNLRRLNFNNTYELDEPKTPALKSQKKIVNTELISENNGEKIGHKRVCRVRFASPSMNSPPAKDKSNPRALHSATPGNKLKSKRPEFITERSSQKNKRPSLIDKKNSPKRGSPRKRSSSLSCNTSKTNNTGSKKRSLSSVDVNRKSIRKSIQDSVNRLSKPKASTHSEKKLEIEPMSAKKVPNFAQIHQKKFSQMESLVDAKKRLEKRHHVLINNISLNNSKVKTNNVELKKETAKGPTPTPKDVTNGVYNRYGYKVRKEEATKIMNKQVPTKKIDDTRTEKRMALKGVRSNRRFEMLMKMRNVKH